MKLKTLAVSLMLAMAPFAQAKELKSIGVTVGDLANPFFVQIAKGAELKSKRACWRQSKRCFCIQWLRFRSTSGTNR
ncbi:D-ribose-binding periplasmic protein RbsB-2 [Pasteurella multocida]|nr:D-ribose-binding periplasmic protein RbsB-2 [Pasteurella multocida]